MKLIGDIFNNIWIQRVFWSLVVILISLIIYRIIARFLNKKEQKNSKILNNKKNKTFIRMLKSIVGYTIGIIAILMILQIFGVNVTSMLAGVGIVSIVVGFALQDALKDIIRGFDLISDDYYNIGDVVKYGDNVGQVLSISLRTTKLQDINSMNIVSIANRNIDQIELVSNYIYIPVPLSIKLKTDEAESVMQEIIKKIRDSQDVTSADYQGITDITNSSINYQIAITCDPMSKLRVRRDSLGTIIKTLESHKISIPYAQLDVHEK